MTAVVVGAGLAGLSAARALSAAGIETVVLEATSRVGGRTRTERSAFSHAQHANLGGSFIDLGQHRIIGLCRELEIPLTPMFSMHPPSGEAGVRKAAMLENHLVLGGELLPREASAAIVAEVEQTLAGHPPQTLETMTAWARRAGLSARARQAFNLLAGINPVDRPERTSATLWTGFPIGDHVWMIRDGTDRLATRLAADADVRTETTVRAIRAAGPRSYTVETDDGDLHASEVILAVPLKGLLEIGFEPELPAWKASAIRALPMSRGGKVACQYGGGAELAAALATGVASDGAVAYASCSSVSAQDTVVVTGLTPDREDGIFDRPEELMSALDELVEAVAGSRPTRVAGVVQDWGSEPRLHGVVSMTASGERLALQARLAAPLAGLHFAGEYATHVWPSSMDGALRSGERAAREVVIRQTTPA